jgi:hypothetical protein
MRLDIGGSHVGGDPDRWDLGSDVGWRAAMRLRLGLGIVAVLTLVLAPRTADAAAGYPDITDNWSNMDRCYKASFDKFPDFTKEAELARQKFVRKCQVQYSLGTSRPLILRQ